MSNATITTIAAYLVSEYPDVEGRYPAEPKFYIVCPHKVNEFKHGYTSVSGPYHIRVVELEDGSTHALGMKVDTVLTPPKVLAEMKEKKLVALRASALSKLTPEERAAFGH